MLARLSIIAGLVVGIVAAGLLLGSIFAFAPEAPAPSAAAPSGPAEASASPAAPSVAPSASASVSPSASAAPPAAAFHVGQPAPSLAVPKVGGGTIDLASLHGNFAKQLGATFPLGLDADRKAAQAWDAIAPPVHFWIDADGIVRDGALGGIGPDVMAKGRKTILPGVDVTP